MTLRRRFMLWFAGAALVSIAAMAALTWRQLAAGYRAEFERTLAAAHEDAQRELERARAAVTSAAAAAGESPLLGALLVDLAKGGEQSATERRELRQNVEGVMRSLGLDTLTLVDENDTVLAAPHFSAHVEDTDPEPRRVRAARGAVVGWAKVLRGGKVARALVVEAARAVSDRGHAITVLAGRELSADLLAPLHHDGIEARLTDAAGADILATGPALAGARSDLLVDDIDGRPIAHLIVAVSDAELRRRLRELALETLGLAAAAVIGAALLGSLVSRRVARDLDALLDGVRAVGRGDLEHQVPVRAADEIGNVASAFNAMTSDLLEAKDKLRHAERVAAWQEIAKSLAHEIKNPLTPIQMSVETLRKTWIGKHPSFDEIFEESTRTVLEEVQRLKKILGEFSQFARMPGPDRRRLDLNDVVISALALYAGTVRVVRELDETLPPLEADRDQLTQVVLNLLENARDAVATRGSDQSVGRITVRTRAGAGAVVLEVEDNGPGFDSALAERLFAPYFTTKAAGTGLGLAIVRRIVTDHGGKIAARSELGRGARFTIELPSS
jgi:signal transduction histidine kinase